MEKITWEEGRWEKDIGPMKTRYTEWYCYVLIEYIAYCLIILIISALTISWPMLLNISIFAYNWTIWAQVEVTYL